MSRSPYVLGKAGGAFGRDQKLEDTTLGWRFVNPAMEEQLRHRLDDRDRREPRARARDLARGPGRLRAAQPAARRARARRGLAVARSSSRCRSTAGRRRASSTGTSTRAPRRRSRRLAGLKPLLGPGTTITAGNASGLNDGAGAVLLASEEAAARYGLEPLARVTGHGERGRAPAHDGARAGAGDPQAPRAARGARSPTTT